MYQPVWQRLVGYNCAPVPAVLHGFQRMAIIGKDYPAVIARKDHHVAGMLYQSLKPLQLQIFDSFQKEHYLRDETEVETASGTVLAEFFRLKPDREYLLSQSEWCQTTFEREGLNNFLQNDFNAS